MDQQVAKRHQSGRPKPPLTSSLNHIALLQFVACEPARFRQRQAALLNCVALLKRLPRAAISTSPFRAGRKTFTSLLSFFDVMLDHFGKDHNLDTVELVFGIALGDSAIRTVVPSDSRGGQGGRKGSVNQRSGELACLPASAKMATTAATPIKIKAISPSH
jgi:hypothetical protein